MILIKLNFGCFRQMFYGWLNIDILDMAGYAKAFGFEFMKLDVRKPLPFPDNYADLIYHCHLIEHLTVEQALSFLRECHRIMKNEAVMRIVTPDLDVILNLYLKGMMDELNDAQPEIYRKFKSQSMKFSLFIFGNIGYTQENYRGHFMIYNYNSLKELLEIAGFNKIYKMTSWSSKSPILQKELDEGIVYDMWSKHSLIAEVIK